MIKEANDSYWDVVWLKKPFVASYWSGRPTADWMFTTAYAADAAWNDTFWKNPRFNELLLAARSETDQAKRAAMYAEMQQLLHDDGGLINIVFNQYVNAHSKKLAHADIGANWDLDGMKIRSAGGWPDVGSRSVHATWGSDPPGLTLSMGASS